MVIGPAAHVGRGPRAAEGVKAATLPEQFKRAIRRGETEPWMLPPCLLVDFGGGEGSLGLGDRREDGSPLRGQPHPMRKFGLHRGEVT